MFDDLCDKYAKTRKSGRRKILLHGTTCQIHKFPKDLEISFEHLKWPSNSVPAVEKLSIKNGFIHLLIVGVVSVAVAIAGLALVIYTVAGLVKVCVKVVKTRHLLL